MTRKRLAKSLRSLQVQPPVMPISEVETQFVTLNDFQFRCGTIVPEIRVAYETWGTLNSDQSNAILIFHALSGTQHVAGMNETGAEGILDVWTDECKPGWWDSFVGPGKAFDTERYFVICANYIGGCYGSTGPSSLNPATGKHWGGDFPRVTSADIVESQVQLLDQLGIETLHAAAGPSIGGLLTLSLATLHPSRVNIVVSIGSALEISALQKLTTFEQVMAIETDPHFNGGHYYDSQHPDRGLALARIISHKTFISIDTLERRARREVSKKDANLLTWYEIESSLESYMLHQGMKFVKRFDANTYLRILEIWQKYDAFRDCDVSTALELFSRCKHQQWLIFSIDSDVCFYPDQQLELANGLREADVPHMHITVHSSKGHDSFLLEPGLFTPHLKYALEQGGVQDHADL